MSVRKLYQLCLSGLVKTSYLNSTNFHQLPLSCLRDILPYLSPYELERLDSLYQQRCIPRHDLWRRHFELIWSLSRDDRDTYESVLDIPYKRLYFEYLFHDTQILQLGIYAHIAQINLSKSIIHLSLTEHMRYNLTRDSIIYCSKRRVSEEDESLVIVWNSRWNQYIKRFILVPHVWNLAKIDPLLIECFTGNVTDLVLSGYPTENDYQGMKFILDVLTRGHITNLMLKFPSYCLMNILLPLFLSPRTYSLSYYSVLNENSSHGFLSNLYSISRQRRLCLQVEIALNEENADLQRVLSLHHQLNEEENLSIDTTQAMRSYSHHSIDSLSAPSSNVEIGENTSQLPLDNQRSNLQPYERLLPYLNRFRTIQPHSTLASVLTPVRHLSASDQLIPPTNLFPETHSTSDSNLFHRHTTATTTISSVPIRRTIDENTEEKKSLLFRLTPEYQTNSLTVLSICYVSSFETIEMIAIALLGKVPSAMKKQAKNLSLCQKGMHQIQHLTLVNFALYSSQLETSLVTLCTRSQLQSLHLTSISLVHGAIGFLLRLFQKKTDEKIISEINLKRLRLDTIKVFAISTDNIHLSDLEQIDFIQNSSLEQFVWRERHMQYIHMRLLYRLLPHIMFKLHRLELSSILECLVFDQFVWCQTFLHHISDVRLRNFRLRPINLARLFLALNTQCILTVFHFERIGLTWTNQDHQSTMIAQAFTSLLLHATHLTELSLAYNNLSQNFMHWLCEMLLWHGDGIERKTTSWWSVVTLNLTFNLISSESMQRLRETLKEYKDRWRLRYSPIRRIDILGNALEMREIPTLKKQFSEIGCDLISYILP